HEARQADVEKGLRQEAEAAADREKEAADKEKKARLEAEAAQKAEEAERKRAEDNFAEARDAVRQLTDIGQRRLAHEPHMELVRREMLQAALGFHRRFLARHADRPGLRFQAALAHLRVGEIEEQLGRPRVAETAYREAVAFLDALPA